MFKSLHIEGRRWFRRSAGHTLTSVTIHHDGETTCLPIESGYGDYYLQLAHEWLGQYYPELAERYDNGSAKVSTTIWLREHGFTYSVSDVQRQKDL